VSVPARALASPSPGWTTARSADAAPILVIALAVIAAYASGLRGSFQFDDYNVIVENPAVHGLAAWWASMPGIRPLLKLSYASNWMASPAAPGFRAFNVACHVFNALMVYLLVRRWLAASDVRVPAPSAAPLIAALVFALHPAQTEAVTYVAGRSICLMSVFYLAALLAYTMSRTARGRLASAGLFALALATRETAWTLPFALVLLQLASGGGMGERPGPGGRRASLLAALRNTVPHWLVLAAAIPAALATPGYRRLLAASLDTRSLKENLLTQIDAVRYLVTHPLFTLRTNIDPDLPVRTALAPDLIAQGAVLAAVAAVGLWQLRRRPWLALGILWCFLHLLPTNSVLPRLDPVNDRHLYLALIGPAMLLARVLQNVRGRRSASVAAAGLLMLLGVATAQRNHDYRSEVALWEATARTSPDKARMWNNLGHAHALAGDRSAALAAYERALRLDPAHVKARYNLEALRRDER
jgi:hypothetical protein